MKKVSMLSIITLVVAISSTAHEQTDLKLEQSVSQQCSEMNIDGQNNQILDYAINTFGERSNNAGLEVILQGNLRAL